MLSKEKTACLTGHRPKSYGVMMKIKRVVKPLRKTYLLFLLVQSNMD